MDNDATASQVADEFFADYTRALLDRDPAAIADRYAVPVLIAFPGQLIAVSDASQTVEFFASAIGQYDAVSSASTDIRIAAATPVSIWADVGWTYDSHPGERNMYQLVQTADGWRIGVLTPLDS
ncbi:hypothetical protein CZ771_05755 [Actinomycetales bacterium JB111]|nr:hypothetical protein CZ771_05755 [Actinomycetales bacterium JB111]